MNKTTTVYIIAILTAALLLTGCRNSSFDDDVSKNESGFKEFTVTMNDGREVPCIKGQNGHAGYMSCDWDNAK